MIADAICEFAGGARLTVSGRNVDRSMPSGAGSGGSFAIQTVSRSPKGGFTRPRVNRAQLASGSDFAVQYSKEFRIPVSPCEITRLRAMLSAESLPITICVIACVYVERLPTQISRFNGLGPSPPVQYGYCTLGAFTY